MDLLHIYSKFDDLGGLPDTYVKPVLPYYLKRADYFCNRTLLWKMHNNRWLRAPQHLMHSDNTSVKCYLE